MHEETYNIPGHTPAERQELLDRFEADPQDPAAWDTAYEWVRDEGDEANGGVAGTIPASELIALAQTVRATPQAGRYALMTEKASNGSIWFDIFEGFSSEQISNTRAEILDAWTKMPDGKRAVFNRALDLGTGTGKSLRALEPFAHRVVGVDRNQALLDVAKQAAGNHTTLVRANIDDLPFEDGSFDLISSSGLTSSLDKHTAIGFYTELARVLSDYGTYLEASYFPDDGGSMGPELARFTETSKAMLTDMITGIVSGQSSRSGFLEYEEQQALLEQLGLAMEAHDYVDSSGTHNHVIVIAKQLPEETNGRTPQKAL